MVDTESTRWERPWLYCGCSKQNGGELVTKTMSGFQTASDRCVKGSSRRKEMCEWVSGSKPSKGNPDGVETFCIPNAVTKAWLDTRTYCAKRGALETATDSDGDARYREPYLYCGCSKQLGGELVTKLHPGYGVAGKPGDRCTEASTRRKKMCEWTPDPSSGSNDWGKEAPLKNQDTRNSVGTYCVPNAAAIAKMKSLSGSAGRRLTSTSSTTAQCKKMYYGQSDLSISVGYTWDTEAYGGGGWGVDVPTLGVGLSFYNTKDLLGGKIAPHTITFDMEFWVGLAKQLYNEYVLFHDWKSSVGGIIPGQCTLKSGRLVDQQQITLVRSKCETLKNKYTCEDRRASHGDMCTWIPGEAYPAGKRPSCPIPKWTFDVVKTSKDGKEVTRTEQGECCTDNRKPRAQLTLTCEEFERIKNSVLSKLWDKDWKVAIKWGYEYKLFTKGGSLAHPCSCENVPLFLDAIGIPNDPFTKAFCELGRAQPVYKATDVLQYGTHGAKISGGERLNQCPSRRRRQLIDVYSNETTHRRLVSPTDALNAAKQLAMSMLTTKLNTCKLSQKFCLGKQSDCDSGVHLKSISGQAEIALKAPFALTVKTPSIKIGAVAFLGGEAINLLLGSTTWGDKVKSNWVIDPIKTLGIKNVEVSLQPDPTAKSIRVIAKGSPDLTCTSTSRTSKSPIMTAICGVGQVLSDLTIQNDLTLELTELSSVGKLKLLKLRTDVALKPQNLGAGIALKDSQNKGPSAFLAVTYTKLTDKVDFQAGVKLGLTVCVSSTCSNPSTRQDLVFEGEFYVEVSSSAAASVAGKLKMQGWWHKVVSIPFLHIAHAEIGAGLTAPYATPPNFFSLGGGVCVGSETVCKGGCDSPTKNCIQAFIHGQYSVIPQDNFAFAMITKVNLRKVLAIIGDTIVATQHRAQWNSAVNKLPRFFLESGIEPIKTCTAAQIQNFEVECYARLSYAKQPHTIKVAQGTEDIEVPPGYAMSAKFVLDLTDFGLTKFGLAVDALVTEDQFKVDARASPITFSVVGVPLFQIYKDKSSYRRASGRRALSGTSPSPAPAPPNPVRRSGVAVCDAEYAACYADLLCRSLSVITSPPKDIRDVTKFQIADCLDNIKCKPLLLCAGYPPNGVRPAPPNATQCSTTKLTCSKGTSFCNFDGFYCDTGECETCASCPNCECGMPPQGKAACQASCGSGAEGVYKLPCINPQLVAANILKYKDLAKTDLDGPATEKEMEKFVCYGGLDLAGCDVDQWRSIKGYKKKACESYPPECIGAQIRSYIEAKNNIGLNDVLCQRGGESLNISKCDSNTKHFVEKYRTEKCPDIFWLPTCIGGGAKFFTCAPKSCATEIKACEEDATCAAQNMEVVASLAGTADVNVTVDMAQKCFSNALCKAAAQCELPTMCQTQIIACVSDATCSKLQVTTKMMAGKEDTVTPSEMTTCLASALCGNMLHCVVPGDSASKIAECTLDEKCFKQPQFTALMAANSMVDYSAAMAQKTICAGKDNTEICKHVSTGDLTCETDLCGLVPAFARSGGITGVISPDINMCSYVSTNYALDPPQKYKQAVSHLCPEVCDTKNKTDGTPTDSCKKWGERQCEANEKCARVMVNLRDCIQKTDGTPNDSLIAAYPRDTIGTANRYVQCRSTHLGLMSSSKLKPCTVAGVGCMMQDGGNGVCARSAAGEKVAAEQKHEILCDVSVDIKTCDTQRTNMIQLYRDSKCSKSPPTCIAAQLKAKEVGATAKEKDKAVMTYFCNISSALDTSACKLGERSLIDYYRTKECDDFMPKCIGPQLQQFYVNNKYDEIKMNDYFCSGKLLTKDCTFGTMQYIDEYAPSDVTTSAKCFVKTGSRSQLNAVPSTLTFLLLCAWVGWSRYIAKVCIPPPPPPPPGTCLCASRCAS
jgi:hypothetical protein